MEHDIYDSLRFIATTCEKMEDALNANCRILRESNGLSHGLD